jgi:hypothetical protein
MGGDIEVEDAPPVVRQNQKYLEDPKADGRHCEEVDGNHGFDVEVSGKSFCAQVRMSAVRALHLAVICIPPIARYRAPGSTDGEGKGTKRRAQISGTGRTRAIHIVVGGQRDPQSCDRSVVVIEQPAKTLTPTDWPGRSGQCWIRADDLVVEALMVPLAMEVQGELGRGSTNRRSSAGTGNCFGRFGPGRSAGQGRLPRSSELSIPTGRVDRRIFAKRSRVSQTGMGARTHVSRRAMYSVS